MSRLFHISDVHFGREDKEALAWFADLVAAERPDGVVLTGDLTQAARRSEYQAAGEWLETLQAPVSVHIGNHDIPVYNPLLRLTAPYRRYEALKRKIDRPMRLDGVTIVPLRTATRAQWRTNWSWGVVRRSSLEAAKDALAAVPAGHLAIIACHHPLVDHRAGTRGRTKGGEAALADLAAAGAHAVITGHVHDPFDTHWPAGGQTIRMIGAGTLSERVRSTRPSFNEIRRVGDGLEVRLREFG